MSSSTIASPLKWHGGKHYLAKRIVGLMPPHLTYCEPFAGGLSVLLEKNPEGVSEVANDLNCELSMFWEVMADELAFDRFKRVIEATPFSENVYELSASSTESLLSIMDGRIPGGVDRIGRAVRFFIQCRQSLAGRMDSFAPLSRSRVRRGMNEQVSAWLTTVEGLPEVHARLKRVAITNRPAVKVIKDLDHPETLFYLDPPYLKSTRTATEVYRHEMTHEDHLELLRTLAGIDGKLILSGYRSDLYDHLADQYCWHRIDIEIDNKAAGGSEKRKMTECLWVNYKPGE